MCICWRSCPPAAALKRVLQISPVMTKVVMGNDVGGRVDDGDEAPFPCLWANIESVSISNRAKRSRKLQVVADIWRIFLCLPDDDWGWKCERGFLQWFIVHWFLFKDSILQSFNYIRRDGLRGERTVWWSREVPVICFFIVLYPSFFLAGWVMGSFDHGGTEIN